MRDRTYCRTKKLQVKDIKGALNFVNKTGFCFAFTSKKSELPCLWHAACGERNPVYPEHTHSDPYIGLVWRAKDVLPGQKAIYYGKALKNRPTMISLQYFPYFYRSMDHMPDDNAYIVDYMRGNLSQSARRIMDELHKHSPQVTAELKLASGYAHPAKRAIFDKAMAELQMKMFVVKIGEFYDPFTFLWDLLSIRYKEEIEQARKITLRDARKVIIQKYFNNVWVAAIASIQRLFRWTRQDMEGIIDELVADGFIINIRVREEKPPFYAVSHIKDEV